MTIAKVQLWGRTIGAVSTEEGRDYAAFQFDPDFSRSEIQLSPFVMPLSDRVYTFPMLPRPAFYGLPGLLADSLPDKFGNALIDAWLATQGRTPESFDAVERLCYTGSRGMGALEYAPVIGPRPRTATKIQIDALVQLASDILTQRNQFTTQFSKSKREKALNDILRIGTSAGGARAKAVIAWNPHTDEIRSGQINAGDGFEYWLLKFDGVTGNRDKEAADPFGFGAIEYAYYLMAKAAGISISDCRLLEENGRRHFMTRRFDRLSGGEKLHMQSFGGLRHFDFNLPGAYSYEQALLTIRQFNLPMAVIEEQFRRMVFNIVARNQDDHVKNIAFLMDKQGQWSLSPAFDLTYSYNPDGSWTSMHQMTVNGKRDNFTLHDLEQCAQSASMKRGRARTILEEVQATVTNWPKFAAEANIPEVWMQKIQQTHRLSLPRD